MVVRVEDLMRWSCAQPPCWSGRAKAANGRANGVHRKEEGGGEALGGGAESEKRPF